MIAALAAAALIVRAPATQRVGGERLTALATAAIHALPHDALREYVEAYPIADQTVVAGAIALHAGTPAVMPAFVDVPISIDVDGRVVRTVIAGYRVQRFVETAVAAHDLAPGSVLGPQDVTMARVPFEGYAANGTGVLMGRKVPGAVAKGAPVYVGQTVVNQLVRAGSNAVLVVRDGNVTLTADVVARTGGGLGEDVLVYNPPTHKQLSVVVVAPHTVEFDIDRGSP